MLMTVYEQTTYSDDTVQHFTWEADIDVSSGIAGHVECQECLGEPIDECDRDNSNLGCVSCKDTGRIWVSI